jgi:hypothetical protein
MIGLVEVQEFFFKAMVQGWAVGGQKIKIADMPGYKAIPFRDGDFYLLDCYCVTPNSPKSAGATTIWFRDMPVWVMNYGGLYDKEAIPFLKRALLKAYEARHFFGGRGPFVFAEGSLIYFNQPRVNMFDKFEGREEVFDFKAGFSLGWHEYWGMNLR